MTGVLSGLFGDSGADAYKQLENQIRQGMQARQQYESSAEDILNPYLGDPRLQKQYETAIGTGEDYQGLLDKLISGYQESPYAKYLTEQGMNAIQHGGAASGMHGSGAEQQELQKNAMNIASGDLQQYLQNNLGLRSDYLDRLAGIADRESQQQFGARTNIGNWRNRLGESLAGDYGNIGQSQFGASMADANKWNSFLGSLGGLFGGGGGLGALGQSIFGGGVNSPFKGWSM